jgi:uncharacterized phiE125 gp8 family phage protein
MTTRRITTTTEPVTAADVKTLLPLTGTDFDTRIALLIPALRLQAEQITQRALAVSTWQLKLDAFPDNEIRLLWPPITAISSITYVDINGDTQTLDSSAYSLDSHSEPGWVLPATGTDWPETYDTANAVTVNYTAGYGADAPEAVKLWIAAMIRADLDGAEPGAIDGLLDNLKVYA